jgi:RNA polymerase sigma-70 factor (family 1)
MMSPVSPIVSDDQFLLKQIEQHSVQAFNVLFEKYWDKAFNEAYKRLKDNDQCKDIVQEIFTHIWIKRETLHIENVPAYFAVAIRNKVLKVLSKQKHIHPFFEILESLPGRTNSADSGLLTKEFLLAYEELISALPPRRQTIFRLRIQDDIYTKDIAKQMGLSRKTVQNQLNKAIEHLRISLLHLRSIIIILIFTHLN